MKPNRFLLQIKKRDVPKGAIYVLRNTTWLVGLKIKLIVLLLYYVIGWLVGLEKI